VLSALPPPRRRLVLAGLAVALVLLTVLVVALVAGRGEPVVEVAQDRPGPVLLVPGYGGSGQSLQALAGRLAAAGRDVQVVELPGGGTGDLGEQAAALGRAATAALARTGAASVDVVGYSAGGVVARLWVRNLGGGLLARRVVTLGSPHHGTSLAGLAGSLLPSQCPPACRQLAPDSDLLRKLNSGDETPAGPRWVSVWSTVDEVVTPPDSARLDGAIDLTVQGVCPRSVVPHGELPNDPVVQGIVLAELAATPVVSLSTSDCARLSVSS
jgi:triacylglycerol esterase/lipase EstA (alpha/beta hydrolase family)